MPNEAKKRKRRLVTKQESLFRTHEEAGHLLKAADDLLSLKAVVKQYKKGSYGIKVKDACLTDKLPKEESQMVCDALNTALQNAATTLCHKVQEISNSIILRVSNEIKPQKGPEQQVTEAPEQYGEENS